jgi:hypothetical protein
MVTALLSGLLEGPGGLIGIVLSVGACVLLARLLVGERPR